MLAFKRRCNRNECKKYILRIKRLKFLSSDQVSNKHPQFQATLPNDLFDNVRNKIADMEDTGYGYFDESEQKMDELKEKFDEKPAFLKEFNETLTTLYAKIVKLKT